MTHLQLAPRPLPMISRTEVHHRPPWALIAGTLQGPVKASKASPELNDDAFRIGAEGDVCWLIVADGVGSARKASTGAHYATYYLDRYLAAQNPGKAAEPETILEGYRKVREQLASHAAEDRAQLHDYATTLLTAVLTPTTATIAKLGDGFAATMNPAPDGKPTFTNRAVNPETADIDGHIVTITHSEWEKAYGAETVNLEATETSALVIATDGAETFFQTNNKPNTTAVSNFATPILNQPEKGLRYASPILHRMFINVIDNPPTYNLDDRTFIIATLNHCGRL